MRSVTLAALSAISMFVGLGLARAAYVGEPFHTAPAAAFAARKLGPTAREMAGKDAARYYIVRLADQPAALYDGHLPGYVVTDAHLRGGRMLDAAAPETRAYVRYLDDRQSEVLAEGGGLLGRGLAPRFRYHYALNGMSLKLTRSEALKLAGLAGVATVEPVRYYKPTAAVAIPAAASATNASRAWVGAPTLWQLASNGNPDTEGEGIVVADVDTGINDANSSFAASGLDGYAIPDPLGSGIYLGVCSSSPPTPKPAFFSCNSKLIGAYSYTLSSGNDPNSPEDSEGHGSHTASTMAGDFTETTIGSASTPLSGILPHANLITYDVCDPTDSCGSDASAEAVDQAIQDQSTLKAAGHGFKGMVLNFSIGGGDASSDPYNDPVQKAFLAAVEAGIYVAASGGNGGPSNVIANDPVNAPVYPVEHVTPWVVSTAAATYDQFLGNDLENFSGGDSATRPTAAMDGESATGNLGPVDIVYSGDYSDPVVIGTAPISGEAYPSSQGTAADAQQCLYPFPSGTFPAGVIVVCDRGTNPLVDKANNVEQGGAGGVVIAATSTSPQDRVTESYVIPGTLIDQTDGDSLRTWLAASVGSAVPAEAELSGSVLDTDASQADQVAGFSSRGPTGTVYDNLVKPDITAPGVGVLAAVSNPFYTINTSTSCSTGCGPNQPETFDFFDGTSMAAPHDTASGGLLMSLHPSWTPAEIRSALMLTAVTTANGTSPGLTDQCASLDSGNNCVPDTTDLPSPQVRGAGRVDVAAASLTGLLLDEDGTDYSDADPDNGGDLTTLNLPSMANAACAGSCSWTRKVLSAFSSASASYAVSVSGTASGLSVSVSPTSFSLAPGKSQVLTVTADSSGVPAGSWAFAEVDITSSDPGDGGAIPTMHMPVAVLSTAPVAHMSINQSALGFSVSLGSSANQQFTISNNGQAALTWSESTLNLATSQSSGAKATAAGKLLSTSTLWSQAPAGNGQGLPSDFFTPDSHGIYSADTFSLPVPGSIAEIAALGFAQAGSSGPVAITGTIQWYIYADSSGQPAGNPEDGKKDYVWTCSADASAAGVDVTNGDITLDPVTAGCAAGDPQLANGSYWLIVAPSFASQATDSSSAAWYWFQGKGTGSSGTGLIIDPADLLGHGSGWESVGSSLAFTLTGTLDCSGAALGGLSLSPQSGSVAAGGTENVTATFSSSGLQTGSYSGAVCVSGDASDNPLIVLPVTAEVSAKPASSGGSGGGGLDLVALMGLAWVLRSRKPR